MFSAPAYPCPARLRRRAPISRQLATLFPADRASSPAMDGGGNRARPAGSPHAAESPMGDPYTRDELLAMMSSSQGTILRLKGQGKRKLWARRSESSSPARRSAAAQKPPPTVNKALPAPIDDASAILREWAPPPMEGDGTGRRVRPNTYHQGTAVAPSDRLPPLHAPAAGAGKRAKPMSGRVSREEVFADWISARKSGERRARPAPPPGAPELAERAAALPRVSLLQRADAANGARIPFCRLQGVLCGDARLGAPRRTAPALRFQPPPL